MSPGNNWTEKLYFKDGNSAPVKIGHDDICDYFKELGTEEERLEEVCHFKCQFNNVRVPPVAGLWHEYLLVGSTKWWWSFEKMAEGIWVQRSKYSENVKEWFDGKQREWIQAEGRKDQVVKRYGETIYDIANWLYGERWLKRGYRLKKDNCQHFASLLFESIARQKGEEL